MQIMLGPNHGTTTLRGECVLQPYFANASGPV
jgi:hypothetical protein